VVRIEGSDDGGTLTGDSAVFSLINGHGGDDTINGGAASDVLTGGDGNDTLNGKGGDDTLFGGNNDDDLYGGSGHDAMSGGAGNDTFHDVDADDLVGTNTLDGTHSIDGGDGIDTVQLGGLASFNSTQAGHMANVEILDFKANSAGDNVGTTVSLNYDAVYGVTQVGGLHELTIHGDGPGVGADHVTLENTAGHTWSAAVNDGTYNTYTSGAGAAQVTVHVDQDVAVV
jgi:hypothetical protein